MPEKVFKKLNTNILPAWKVCFFSAIITGLFAHLYKITSWLPNWDSLVFRYDPQNMLSLGRWFLPVVCSPSSFYDLPFLNGIIAIVFHAVSAVFIFRILGIRRKITAALTGALIVSFPTVTSVMMYNYVADGYSIAFFLSTLAAFYMTSEKPRYLLSVVLIALSVGIYQAYITVTIMLVLIHLLNDMIFEGASLKGILKKAACMLTTGVLGALLYSVILKLILAVFSVELIDYQGVESAMSLSNIDLLASLYIVKETFLKFFFDLSQGINLFSVLNALVLIFTLVYYIRVIVKNRIYKSAANCIAIIVLSISLILGAGALAFINAQVDHHNLMLMGYAVFYLFFIQLYEKGEEKNERICAVKCWSVLLIALVVIANQVVTANVSYHKAQMAYERSYGTLIRIADRIEQTEGAENCDRILVIGALDNSEDYSVILPPDITGITDGYIIRADDETVGQSVLTSGLNDYCGKNYEFVSGDEKKEIMQRERVKTMGKWPKADCVIVLDDTLVINLGTEGEN